MVAKNFFDEEAELGSDNELNDDARKAINKDDLEENEDGLDSDLDGFVAKGDDVEIGDAPDGAMNKFLQDMKEDDKKRTQIAMQAALFGQNRKRKREQFDEDELDDYQKRRQERLQEREQMLNCLDEEELQQHLLEGGKNKALKAMEMKQLIEEEELSDDEVIKQMEHNKYYSFMRERAKKEQLKEIEKKNEEIDIQLQNMCVDLDEEKRIKKLALKRQIT